MVDAKCTHSQLGCTDGWIQLTDASKDRWPPISLTQLTASPDGRYLGFTRLDQNAQGMIEHWNVHTLDIEKCRAEPSGCTYDQTFRLTSNPEQDGYDPAWSPTDDRIAMVLDSPAFYGIAFTSPKGQHQELVLGDDQIADSALLESLAWAPDGRTLALTVAAGAGRWIDTYIYTISLDGPKVAQVTAFPHREAIERMDVEPRWSPDGQMFVFASNHRHETWVEDFSVFYLYTMNADGSDVSPLGIQGYSPVWSPDSSKILYLQFNYLYTVNARGGEPMQLTNGNSPGLSEVIWIP